MNLRLGLLCLYLLPVVAGSQPAVPIVDLAGVWQGTVEVPAPPGIPLRPVTYRLIVERDGAPVVRTTSGDEFVDLPYRSTVEVTGYRFVAANTAIPCYHTFSVNAEAAAITFLNPVASSSGQVFGFFFSAQVEGEHRYPGGGLMLGSHFQAMRDAAARQRLLENGEFEANLTLSNGNQGIDFNVPGCAGTDEVNRVAATIEMKRIGSVDVISPKASISGQLSSSLPILTDPVTGTSNLVQRARIVVYLQADGRVRLQNPGETDSQYAAFLDRQVRNRVPLNFELNTAAGGAFTLDGIPLLQSVGNRKRSAAYMLVIEGAQTDEVLTDEFGDPVAPTQYTPVQFQRVRVPNITAGTSGLSIVLDPIDGIGTKLSLIEHLNGICPDNYGPPENDAFAHVIDIRDENITVTEAILEGLDRGVVAERVAQRGVVLANELSKEALNGLGALLADIFSEFYKPTGVRLARAKKLEGNLSGSGLNIENLRPGLRNEAGQMSKRLDASVAGGFYDKLIAAAKPRFYQSLVNRGVSPTDASSVTNGIVLFLRSAFQALSTQSLGGASKEAIKLGIKTAVQSLAPLLIDDLPGFSYCQLTAGSLADSVTRMQGWSTAADGVYRQHRSNAYQVVGQFSTETSQVLADARIALAVAGGTSAVSSAAGALAPASPLIALLEKFAKLLTYLNNGSALASSGYQLFISLPAQVERGICAAYGLNAGCVPTNKQTLSWQQQAAKLGPGQALEPDAQPVLDALTALDASLSQDQLGQAAEDLFADQPLAVHGAIKAWDTAVQQLLAQAGGLATVQTTAARDAASLAMTIAAQRNRLQLLETRTIAQMTRLLTDALGGVYPDTLDPAYRIQRRQCLSLVDRWRRTVQALADNSQALTTALDSAVTGGDTVLPAVFVELPEPVSGASGESAIAASGESFVLTADISQLGGSAVSNLTARLQVRSQSGALTLLDPAEQPVNGGTLGDGASAQVTWNLRYDGDLSLDVFQLHVDVLESGAAPGGFTTATEVTLLTLDAAVIDADLDLMADDYETQNGLDTGVDDRLGDADNDGLTNGEEFDLGTLAGTADSDNDSLSDGEETIAGNDGWVTDPRSADTDGDGVDDAMDGAPLDASSTASATPPGEPVVALSDSIVALNGATPFASVTVSNAGGGSLNWTVSNDFDGLVTSIPRAGETSDSGELLLSLAPGFSFDPDVQFSAQLEVVDTAGGEADRRTITVLIAEEAVVQIVDEVFANGFESP